MLISFINWRKFSICPWICSWLLAMNFPLGVSGADSFVAGPLFSQFTLTLDAGRRTEAIGPFFYDEGQDSDKTWAIPPLFSRESDPDVELEADDLVYPVLTYRRFGTEY